MDNVRFSFPMQIGDIIDHSQELKKLISDLGLELKDVVMPDTPVNYSVEQNI